MRAALLALLCACARPVDTADLAPRVTPWCFRVAVDFAGGSQAGNVCAESLALCHRASGLAVQLGGVAGLTAVGDCRRGGR